MRLSQEGEKEKDPTRPNGNVADASVTKEASWDAALQQRELIPRPTWLLLSSINAVALVDLGGRYATKPTYSPLSE